MVAAIAAVIVAVVFIVGRQTCENYETTATNDRQRAGPAAPSA